ncbi:L-lactate permease [Marininema mesophilum]|nr:L-lactate permease [Marininema mesophilum]
MEYNIDKSSLHWRDDLKGILTTSIVSYVLFFGILLFNLINEARAIEIIESFVSKATQNPTRQVLLIAVAFSPLVESASGFGLAMIVIAPILIALGFDKYKAVLISLLSLTAVPWGALATGTVIGSNLTEYPLSKLGTGSAILSVPTFFYFSFLMVLVSGGFYALRKHFWEVILVSSSLSLAVWFFNYYVSVELAGVFGAIIALSVELLLIRITQKKATILGKLDSSSSIIRAMSAYILLIILLFITRTFPLLENNLKEILVLQLPKYDFTLPLLYAPGFYLLLVCIYVVFIYKVSTSMIKECIIKTVKQLIPVLLSTLVFVVMSQIMDKAGMTQILSSTAATFMGSTFIYISPIIGGLGGFLTGSNTGSNAMFMNLQLKTAQHLHMSPDLFAFAQNTSSSHLTMACPSRVVLATTIGKIPEHENQLLRTITLVGIGTLILLIVEVALWKMIL